MVTLLTLVPTPQRLFTSTPALQQPVPRQTAPCPLVTAFSPLPLPNRAISLLVSDPIGPAPEPSWLSQAQGPGVDSHPFSSHPCCHQIRPASNSLLWLLPQPRMPFLTVLSRPQPFPLLPHPSPAAGHAHCIPCLPPAECCVSQRPSMAKTSGPGMEQVLQKHGIPLLRNMQ